jgi:hypothetical protein
MDYLDWNLGGHLVGDLTGDAGVPYSEPSPDVVNALI